MPRESAALRFERPAVEARVFVLVPPPGFDRLGGGTGAIAYREALAAVFFALGAYKVEVRASDGAFEVTLLRDTRPTEELALFLQQAANNLPTYAMRAARAATARSRVELTERIGRPAPGESAFDAMQREFREASKELTAAMRAAGVYALPELCHEECPFCGQPIGDEVDEA